MHMNVEAKVGKEGCSKGWDVFLSCAVVCPAPTLRCAVLAPARAAGAWKLGGFEHAASLDYSQGGLKPFDYSDASPQLLVQLTQASWGCCWVHSWLVVLLLGF